MSGEKTVVTKRCAQSLTMYVPPNVFSVNKGGFIVLADYPIEIVEIIVSVIDSTSVKVTFDTKYNRLIKNM